MSKTFHEYERGVMKYLVTLIRVNLPGNLEGLHGFLKHTNVENVGVLFSINYTFI